jgi:hypothetical protein
MNTLLRAGMWFMAVVLFAGGMLALTWRVSSPNLITDRV